MHVLLPGESPKRLFTRLETLLVAARTTHLKTPAPNARLLADAMTHAFEEFADDLPGPITVEAPSDTTVTLALEGKGPLTLSWANDGFALSGDRHTGNVATALVDWTGIGVKKAA